MCLVVSTEVPDACIIYINCGAAIYVLGLEHGGTFRQIQFSDTYVNNVS